MKRQCVRLHRRAFATQVPPIQRSIKLHAAPRSAVSTKAAASEGRLTEVLKEAGFHSFRRAAETPFNLVIEARN